MIVIVWLVLIFLACIFFIQVTPAAVPILIVLWIILTAISWSMKFRP